MKRAAIVGGGLAGLAGAVALAEAGFAVTVYERRRILGGRASSFTHPSGGELVDNCQHVLLECCVNLMDFYRRLGVEKNITFQDTIPIIDELNRVSCLYASPLPAPFHLLPSFLRLKSLGWKDKISVSRTMIRMIRHIRRNNRSDDRLRDDRASPVSMLEWLLRNHATERALSALWRPILISALNDELDDIDADYGISTITRGFLMNRRGYRIGLPTAPLGQLYTPAISFLERRGGRVELNRGVSRLMVSEGRVTALAMNDGTEETADVYMSAVPFDGLLKLLPESVVREHRYFSELGDMEVSPITAVHLWFEEPVTDMVYAAILGRHIQWVFNQSVRTTDQRAGCCLGLVVSASDEWMKRPQEEIIRIAVEDLASVFPKAHAVRLLKAIVVKEGRATFAPKPGCDRWRPDPGSPLPNLFVAGDWTHTGWPATMESATRSGYKAAEAMLASGGLARSVVKPELPADGMMRWLPGLIWEN